MEFIRNWRGKRLYEEATQFYQDQNYKEALKYFRELKKVFPDWSEPPANMASCYYFLEAYDRALTFIDQALALKPDLPAYLFNKALILVAARDLEAASLILQALLKEHPLDAQYVEFYGNILFEQEKYDDALKLASDFLPHTEEPIPVLLFLGDVYEKLGLYLDAVDVYSEVLKQDSDHLHARHNRGYFLMQLERYEAAKEDFDLVITRQPQHAYAYHNRGFVFLQLGEIEKAFSDLQQSITLDPKNAFAYRNLGHYYLKKHQKSEAIQHFEQAIALGLNDHSANGIQEILAELRGATE